MKRIVLSVALLGYFGAAYGADSLVQQFPGMWHYVGASGSLESNAPNSQGVMVYSTPDGNRQALSIAVLNEKMPTGSRVYAVPEPVAQDSQPAQQPPVIKMGGHQCGQTTVASVSGGGSIVKTSDGHIFHVGSYGQFNSQMWLPGDDLLVCVTTGTYNSKPVSVYTLRDLDSGDQHSHSARLLE